MAMWIARFLVAAVAALWVFPLSAQYENLPEKPLAALMASGDDTTRIMAALEMVARLQDDEDNDSARVLLNQIGQWIEAAPHFKSKHAYYHQWGLYHEFSTHDADSSEYFYAKAVEETTRMNNTSEVLSSLRSLAYFHFGQENYAATDSLLKVAIALAREANEFNKLCDLMSLQGLFYYFTDDATQADAAVSELKTLAFRSEGDLQKGTAFFEVGNYYWSSGDMPSAIFYFLKAHDRFEAMADSAMLLKVATSLSEVYSNIGEFNKAVVFQSKCIELTAKYEWHPELAANLNSLGWHYYHLNDFENALRYVRESKRIYDQYQPNNPRIAYPIGNIGLIMCKTQEWDSAIAHSRLAAELFGKLYLTFGVAEAYDNIANAYLGLGRTDSALHYARLGLALANESEDPQEQRNAYHALYRAHKRMKHFDLALAAHERYLALGDSLYNKDQLRRSMEMEQELAEERDAAIIQNLELADQMNQSRLKQQRIALIVGTVVFVAILLMLVQMFRLSRATKKAYTKLALKHTELEESQRTVLNQNEQILIQKVHIEEQHKDIIASINFASRIQHAMLKPEEHVERVMPPHFILFRPRDIVSGDCYWIAHNAPHLYVAAIDCTGHGVPGAMMSMLVMAFLNEIIADDRYIEPADLLGRLRERVIKELGQQRSQETSYREGADVALVRLNLDTSELTYAGANNPLWLVRNGELIEYKANKQGVSFSDHMTAFEQHELTLEKDDTIYIFSDGFADQLGGPKGKKLKSSTFKQILINIHKQSMQQQKQHLADTLDAWRGDMEQVDDVCVIGLQR